jgi:uncharacterized protein with HEPN domain
MLNASLLSIIDEAGVAVLTLTEGLEKDEFLGSRLTRAETLRQVRIMSTSAGNVPPPTRALLPEVEWRGWQSVALQLEEGAEAQGEALWFAVRSLVPATLMWLRVYRHNQPQLFQWAPAPVADGARS